MLDTLRDGVVYGDVRHAQDIALLEGLRAANFVTGTIDELYGAGVLYVTHRLKPYRKREVCWLSSEESTVFSVALQYQVYDTGCVTRSQSKFCLEVLC